MASRGRNTATASRVGFGRWCAGAGVVTVLLTVALLGRVGGATTVRTFSDLAECAVALAAAGSCAARAAGAAGRHRWFWALLAGAALSWAAGQACWTWYEVVRGAAVPFPSAADVGFAGMPVLTVAALLA